MADDRHPPEHEADTRDERVAELLAVPPLDEVTRRRLVRGALEATEPRPSRLAGVAAMVAAIVIGAGIGAVLVNQPDQTSAPTAAAPTEAADPVAPDADTSGGEAFERAPAATDSLTSGAPLNDLGALGDVSTARRLRRAVSAAFATEAPPGDAGAFPAYPCLDIDPRPLDLAFAAAVGAGVSDDQAVTVVVGTSPTGETRAVVIGPPPECRLVRSVELPRR